MNYKLISITIFTIVFFNSCNLIKIDKHELGGVYFCQNGNSQKITIIGNKYYITKKIEKTHLINFKCCDTISFGKWKLDSSHKFLEFNSSKLYNKNTLEIDVLEEKTNTINDSICFIINNPIEQHYKNLNEKYKELNYTIITNIFDHDIDSKTSDKNMIFFSKKSCLKTLQIVISPKKDIPLSNVNIKEISTFIYKIQNQSSNLFKINIPKLTYNFLTYERLKSDYLKIKNKNTLIWNSEEYIKTDP